jgi:hypothetical protein
MHCSLFSLGLIASMLMASSVYADGVTNGVGHAVDEITHGNGGLSDDGIKHPIENTDHLDIFNGFPFGIIHDVIPDATKAAASSVERRRTFLARRKLGHAIHQRRSGADIESTLDATTDTAMKLKGKVAMAAVNEVQAQMANTDGITGVAMEATGGAIKTAGTVTGTGAKTQPDQDELSDDETPADLLLSDEVGDDETDDGAATTVGEAAAGNLDRRSKGDESTNSDEGDEDEEDEDEDDSSTGNDIARRSEEEAEEDGDEADEDEDEGDEEEDDDESDLARRAEENADNTSSANDEVDEEEEDENEADENEADENEADENEADENETSA